MDRWMCRQVSRQMYGWVDGEWMHGWVGSEWAAGQVGRWVDRCVVLGG
jgi:hypothetical protein